MKKWTINSPRASRRASLTIAAALFAAAAAAHEAPNVAADFDPPAPGTYRLERIMPAPDGTIVDARRKRGQLADYTHRKVTLLSLMFTACGDENGCPLAFATIDLIKRDLEKSKATRGRVQMVSLSFDPSHDTPDVMLAYAGEHAKGGNPVPWHFLTTTSKQDLAPIIDGFGQDVSRAANGNVDRELMHVLKLFLIDKDGWIREIYSTSYLIPQVVLNDIKTLLIEQGVKIN